LIRGYREIAADAPGMPAGIPPLALKTVLQP